MMAALDATQQRRLVASARLLDSNRDGEILAALAAVKRLLPGELSLADLIERGLSHADEPIDFASRWNAGESDTDWRSKAHAVLSCAHLFEYKELRFAQNMFRARLEPSEKQRAWLHSLWQTAEADRAAA